MIGTLWGRRAAADRSFPCRVHHLKRPIPIQRRFLIPGLVLAAGEHNGPLSWQQCSSPSSSSSWSGLVPFGCVFIEMYFVFSSLWSYNKIYYVYGFMLAILGLLTMVVICVSITCVYLLLNNEDYRWQWMSFLCSSSIGVYIAIYSIYYYYHSTQMSGFSQWLYYVCTTSVICLGMTLFCGTVGYLGACKFVFAIYRNIKSD